VSAPRLTKPAFCSSATNRKPGPAFIGKVMTTLAIKAPPRSPSLATSTIASAVALARQPRSNSSSKVIARVAGHCGTSGAAILAAQPGRVHRFPESSATPPAYR
jgi:hypothetical protein